MSATHPPQVELPNAVRRTLAVVAIARTAQFAEAVLFPLVAVEHGAGTAGAATVLLFLAAGSTAGALLGGALVDRAGTRTSAAFGLSAASASAGTLALTNDMTVLAAAALAYGAATAIWRLALEGATTTGLAAASPPEEQYKALRQRAFGAFVWLVNLGALVSAVALLAGIGLRTAIEAQAALLAVAGVAAIALLDGRGQRSARGVTFRGVPAAVWLLGIAFAPFTMVMFQAFAGLAEVFDDADYRVMVFVNALTLVVFPPLLWSRVSRLDGSTAVLGAGALQGLGVAAGAVWREPVISTVFWTAGEAVLIALLPAVLAGVAPHRGAGHYRAAFSLVQGIAAAIATFVGPVLAHEDPSALAFAVLAATAVGVVAMAVTAPTVRSGLSQPVSCPCGAFTCACDVMHAACARLHLL